MGRESKPFEVRLDRRDILLPAALQVGVVDPQHEPPAMLDREQRVVERGADVADVEPASRRGGETGDDAHAAPLAPGCQQRLAALKGQVPASA